jgi:glucosylceramidase
MWKAKFFFWAGIWVLSGCNKSAPPAPAKVWVSSADRTELLSLKTLDFTKTVDERFPTIQIDTAQTFQQVDGFGFTLTGGSALLIRNLPPSQRTELLKELFGNGDASIGISYLRISIGASDLDESVFSYNDLPPGQTDPELQYFSLAKDTVHLIPLLQEILSVNPDIKIMGSPWSAPVWMKDNGSSIGGSLQPRFYGVYARYLTKYIQSMQAQGIAIDAVTPQNEPQHGGNNPSMVMSAAQQAEFIKNHLGPTFAAMGIATKIIIWDHNCDNPAYPISILNDPAAKAFIDGSAFHLYAGDISALSEVHSAHPDRNLYFTEQWTGAKGDFGGDLKWHLKNVIIGSMRNWSKTALEWNLANDSSYGPHTPGGCNECKGALTIDASSVTRNVSYYVVAQASKFVPPGSVRVGSNAPDALPNVAFKRPDGKNVLIVLNEADTPVSFNIGCHGRWIVSTLHPGSVGTYVWE